jgi:hypothetical protein
LLELLRPLTASERLIGTSVADLQADLDPDGTHARRVTELLTLLLAGDQRPCRPEP